MVSNYKILKPSANYIEALITLILQPNTFELNFHKQACGGSMGSPASPEIADITFHNLETNIIELHKSKIYFWKRFRDDLFMIYTGTQNQLHEFITNINGLHETFKFSYEFSPHTISYLDLDIFKSHKYTNERILDTRTHTKATDTFQYLSRNSCHPIRTFKGLIKGELLRYARTCNNNEDFISKVHFFTQKLQRRNYKKAEITQIIREVKHTERDTYLKNKNKTSKKDEDKKIIYTTRYSPYIKTTDIKKALTLNWDIIENNTVLAAQFPQKPIIAYRRNKNLKDTLIKTKMNITNNVATLDVQARRKNERITKNQHTAVVL